jgi:hypothetical protein
MNWVKNLTVALAVSFILGCSGAKAPEPPPPPQKTVFDPVIQPLGRAKEVQGVVDANADATGKAVAEQERGDNPP